MWSLRNVRGRFWKWGSMRSWRWSYSTAFDSVIAFGPIRPAHDDTEKRMGLMALLGKYSSMVPPERAMRYLEAQLDRTSVIVMDLERVTGKHHA